MSSATLTSAPAGRVKLSNLYVMIDGRQHEIVNMNIVDVLVAGAPDWIAPRQKIEFSFVLSLDGKQRALPTYGVVVRNDAKGLEVRYNGSFGVLVLNLFPESYEWQFRSVAGANFSDLGTASCS